MTDILFIAYEFPPLNRGGVIRPLKFVKYLPAFGINPVVFRLSPASYQNVYSSFSVDDFLCKEIPASVTTLDIESGNINKLYENSLRRFFSIYFNLTGGDEVRFWKRDFQKKVQEVKDKFSFKAVVVTAPPFGMAKLGAETAKQLNIPLILDMRDAWSFWCSKPYGSYLHYYFTKQLERKCFGKASAVIGVTRQMINDWKTLHPEIQDSKFCLIPNGFDSLTLSSGTEIKYSPVPEKKFVIGYVGSFYYSPGNRKLIFSPWWTKAPHRMIQYVPRMEDWRYRSPWYFFQTVRKCIDADAGFKNKITIRFAGVKPAWFDAMVREFGLEEVVEHIGFLPHERIPEFEKKCDALLSTSAKVIGGEDYCIAGKTYEYIESGKPILAFVTPGAQRDFLSRSRTAMLFDPDNTHESVKLMRKVVENGFTLFPDKAFLNDFHRKGLTKRLAELIEKVILDN